jgi:hypothetical protein
MDIRFSFVGGFREVERSMMKAARIHKFGPPSVIVIEELPWPGYGQSTARGAAVHRDLAEIGDK